MILPEHLNQDTVKHANGRHAKNPSWPLSIAHHRGFLIIKPPPGVTAMGPFGGMRRAMGA
jgi:hypothetical protein